MLFYHSNRTVISTQAFHSSMWYRLLLTSLCWSHLLLSLLSLCGNPESTVIHNNPSLTMHASTP